MKTNEEFKLTNEQKQIQECEYCGGLPTEYKDYTDGCIMCSKIKEEIK